MIFDSEVEKMFAEDAQKDDEVVIYAKLPTKFYIETTYGKYSPDWILLIRSKDGDKLYFVAETKGNKDKEQLRTTELGKTSSGKKHYETLNNGIEYRIVKDFKDLKLD